QADLDRLRDLVAGALPRAEIVTFPPGGGVTEVAAVLASVDLALSAAGTTTWELLAWGVPSLLVSLADNQDPVLDAVDSAGIALRLPRAGGQAVVAATAADRDLRQTMVDKGQRLVDGDGARRVVVAFRAALTDVRPVTPDDSALLWRWANEPSTRANAIRQAAIGWDEHIAWLEAGRRALDRLHWIIEMGGIPVGQVRFDGILHEPCTEISVSVDSSQRNLGYGAVVIRAGVAALQQRHRGRPIIAVVRPDNVASLRSFDLAGFAVEGSEVRQGVDLVRLRLDEGICVGNPG
ncbi:MAG: GNAT family N-acetyltransferase, partial [Acidimicrobiales bacterium]